MVGFSVLSTVNIGCSQQLGEGTADADSDVGVATEALTQTELSCAAMSLLTPGLNASERMQFTRGCVTYRTETFDGNGRTCESCHMLNLGNGNPDDNNFDLSIEDVETAWAEDPTGPLFRSIDADDGESDFTTLRTLADVRVSLPLHPNVSVVPDGSPLVSADGRTVTVWRSTPTSENIVLDANVMWDGRFGDDLELQVREAVLAHFEPGRAPTAQEQADLAFFQSHLFSNERVRTYADGGAPPTLPTVPSWLTGSYWDSVRRGRRDFEDVPVSATGGFCATCHSGPMLNLTNEFNPVQPRGEAITNNFVSETQFLRSPEAQLPVHTYQVVLDHPVFMPTDTDLPIPPGVPLFPPGMVFTVLGSPDPGRILRTGDPCEVVAACLIQTQALGIPATTSFFKIPTLWGAADSAPYFHDNSARTIEEAMIVYRFLGEVTADGLNALGVDGEGFRLSDQRTMDIINYFEYAFRHRPVLNP